jgi:hypothetical protein
MPALPARIALLRDVPATVLDPLTLLPIDDGVLPAGTMIEDPASVLADAEGRQLESVVVRVVDDEGWTGLQRIATASLRRAVG